MGTNEKDLAVLTENMANLSLKMTSTVVSSSESSGDIVKHVYIQTGMQESWGSLVP